MRFLWYIAAAFRVCLYDVAREIEEEEEQTARLGGGRFFRRGRNLSYLYRRGSSRLSSFVNAALFPAIKKWNRKNLFYIPNISLRAISRRR